MSGVSLRVIIKSPVAAEVWGAPAELDALSEFLTFETDVSDDRFLDNGGDEFGLEKRAPRRRKPGERIFASALRRSDEGSVFAVGLLPKVLKEFPDLTVEGQEFLPDEVPLSEIEISGDYLGFPDGGMLRDYQTRAAQKAIHFGRGSLEIATGGGKTEVCAAVIKFLLGAGKILSAVISVPSDFLLEQTYLRLIERGLGEWSSIGRYGSGYRETDAQIVVATHQSIYMGVRRRDRDVLKFLSEPRSVFWWDEGHRLSAPSYAVVAHAVTARWRYSASGTIHEYQGKFTLYDAEIEGFSGPLLVRVPPKVLIESGVLARPTVFRIKISSKKLYTWDWKNVYRDGVMNHRGFNETLLSAAISLFNRGDKVLIFVSQKNHGNAILRCLAEHGYPAIFGTGGLEVRHVEADEIVTERWTVPQIKDAIEGDGGRIVLATSAYDEGVDIPAFSAVLLMVAQKRHRRLIQRIGRALRAKPGDNTAVIVDPDCSYHPFLAAQARTRADHYRYHGFECVVGDLSVLGDHLGISMPVYELGYKGVEDGSGGEEDWDYHPRQGERRV